MTPTATGYNTPINAAQRARAQAHLAHARDAALNGAEWPAPDPAQPPDAVVAVVGAGTMGSGIAQCALAAGLRVHLLDTSEAAAQRGAERMANSLARAVARGRLTPQARAEQLARLRTSTNGAGLAEADVVIEAIVEDPAAKQALLAQLHAACPPHTLLLSNTSTLDIDELAHRCGRPDRVAGMHFLTPAQLTPLVEVVRGHATSDTSLARARALALRLGKLPVLAGNAWGFIGNRMFEGYLREVDALQLQGVAAHQIDRALENFGFALGPCRTLDMAGTDLVSQVLAMRERRFQQPPAYRRITRRLAELGRWGHKSGRGHYLHDNRQVRVDPDLARLCAEEAARLGIAPIGAIDDAAIVQRCLEPLVQEGHRLLAEGMACRASDIDLVWVLGYGFPADRGGPMALSAVGAGV
ncbi:MAG: 3-hydroxyacyl-CoA dehydrogenase NAD-binding domain-containing protein [Hydrogenophaga sp.]|jgi:3-hydroxyacyl-CoA dehydrogenase|uniref:3-hydroxyacyl-CoA dehydrogenase n=1 Tax=Hydrogenophaga sp. TaxID=1904254 RepID=UPI00271F668B|nr:3-hydroxyacyl-CoA dehydrogenase [Hydrogenophaga sp.]MDO9484025.1 3-hydroxyacyl-CoA dehydrogenase NAD-binding domain-containing protein [Hydrogenophaga sp.]MDO9570773.1 3-hydroxyacyl-CoA dehydrogenase NAD-binding domain-containing protein [Hydrogenophaga sp.]MDP3342863.1 3-hydroxyacyl-CoA dehydrogenase NAD-binding domain-containing protein [Hydrogenophaga sp.]MDP3374128.1 3-hydroxyacyl-CoA dehydrogenase NAD-binding domain-containing protein [Hydrogenophaga sp.]MDP3808738.1 3-hydroxyacyl-CoA 